MKHFYFASCTSDGGVYHYIWKNRELQFLEKWGCDCPMYLLIEGKRMWILLRQPFKETPESGVVTCLLDRKGRIKENGEAISSEGLVACHLCSYCGKIYVANYSSGSIFCTDGTLRSHIGSGPNTKRQEMPHIHFISPAPDNACILATDLGTDQIYSYSDTLERIGSAGVPAGYGPRHLAFSADGNTVFCVNELDSSVSVFRYERGELHLLETVSVLKRKNSENLSAAIRVGGKYVYVSNRGNDSISCLEWDGTHLCLKNEIPCGGNSPRDFILEDGKIFCANEQSGTVTILDVDGLQIRLTERHLDIPGVLCVAVYEA